MKKSARPIFVCCPNTYLQTALYYYTANVQILSKFIQNEVMLTSDFYQLIILTPFFDQL